MTFADVFKFNKNKNFKKTHYLLQEIDVDDIDVDAFFPFNFIKFYLR